MLRKALPFLLTLMIIPVMIQAVDSTYYFVKYSTEGVTIEEIIEILSDSTQTAPSGFVAKTYNDIHRAGYMTPSETEERADTIDQDTTTLRGYSRSSWLTKAGNKTMYCGSKTGRTWVPGWCYLKCRTTYTHMPYPSSYHYFPDSQGNWHRVWGYYTKHVWKHDYPSGWNMSFNQHGWHKYSDGGEVKETNVNLTW